MEVKLYYTRSYHITRLRQVSYHCAMIEFEFIVSMYVIINSFCGSNFEFKNKYKFRAKFSGEFSPFVAET